MFTITNCGNKIWHCELSSLYLLLTYSYLISVVENLFQHLHLHLLQWTLLKVRFGDVKIMFEWLHLNSLLLTIWKNNLSTKKNPAQGRLSQILQKAGICQRGGALCVQMDFTRTFEANTKCNNKNHVWSHFYNILVVLKYHRRFEPIFITQTFVGA